MPNLANKNYGKTEHQLKVVTGKTSCEYAPGEVCRFYVQGMFVPQCTLYNRDLVVKKEGYTLRCNSCLKELN